MKSINVIKEIKQVLATQATGIHRLGPFIGPSYKKAVEMMFRCTGKIVVTGIGKSGMVAQKIASTLTSTGSPAIYLHPTEGLHGSLGVIHKSDIVLAIGKSGESEEILQIIPSIKKIGAKIIAITSNRGSSLSKHAAITLYVPVIKEACPLNLAPTTSSTLALVVGDALAIALMKKRGFGEENFALYHPGGLLGKKLLLKVSDVMRSGRENPVVNKTASMDRLMIEIAAKWAGAASIVNEKGKLIGLVTDFDIRKAFARGKKISDFKIPDLMNPSPIFIRSDEMAVKALQMMEARKKPLTILPVVDKKKRAVGMVHVHDLINKGFSSDRRPR